MPNVTFSADPPPLDEHLEDRWRLAAGKSVKVRLQPDVYNHTNGRYESWVGLIWTVELDTLEEGRRLREGLTNFFKLFGQADAQGQVLNLLAIAAQTWESKPAGHVRGDLYKDSVGAAGDGSKP